MTTVTFDNTKDGTLLTHVIRHKSRAVRDAHLQAGMEAGTIQTFTRLDRHTAVMEEAANLLPRQLFLRFSAVLQAGVMCTLLIVYFVEPSLESPAAQMRQRWRSSAGIRAVCLIE